MLDKPSDKPSDRPPANSRDTAAKSDFENLHEIVAKAKQNLNQNNWDYIVGGTESETTLRRNRLALNSVAFRPRVLVDVSKVDASVEHFGCKMRLPILLAPVGNLECFHEGGATTSVKAAGAFGVAHMLSSVCEPGLEKSQKLDRTPCASFSSMCAATPTGWTTMSAVRSTRAMPRSASPSTPRITAAASATSPSGT